MGIQLPAELVEVAAKAGVTWPEADEDAMRTAAAAWRDAGNRVTGLAGDSDGSATKALTGITGATGDAARTHWNRVVAPDGDLNTTAKGCHAAADRLEHGADQIGAAKVELVRELVNLAKNNDAAQSAAAAGHPTALLGLDTALAGATANVSTLTNTLTSSVRLDSGVDVGTTSPPVNANPGSHGGGGLLGTVLAPVATVVAPVTDVVAGVVPAAVAPVAGVLPVVADVVPAVVAPVTDAMSGVVPAVTQAVPAVVGPVTDVVPAVTQAVAAPVVDFVPGTAPQVLAPVQQVVPDVAPAVTAPAAPVVSGIAPPAVAVDFGPAQPLVNTTDGTVAQSAATLMAPIEAPVQQAPAQQAPAPPAQGPTQAPGLAAPAPPAAPVAPAAPAAGGAVVGAVQRTDQPVSQRLGGEQQATQQRTADQTTQQRTESKPAAGAQSQAPGSQPQQTAPTGKEGRKPEDAPAPVLAAFLFFRGPSGTAPQPSTRPKQQVEPTTAEVDHVNGLRFAPQDHPHADLISTAAAQAHTTPAALGPDHPMVLNLTDGYDPQAGLHEREWDAKFVRTAVPLEHAWPPAAEFPEGGYEAGRPDVLSAGTEVDRFGTPEGRVLAAAGTRFAGRSLPPVDLAAGYRRYVLTQPVPVWRTISVGWFGQPGGGTRYRTTYPVADLVALGYLMELT